MELDDATIGRIFTRRAALAAMARAGVGLAVGGAMARPTWAAVGATVTTRPASPAATLVAAPALTEGPFFVEERLNRSDLVAGSTRPSVAEGRPLELSIGVHRILGNQTIPMRGAHVELWHCDAIGIYSDEADPMNNELTSGQRWLRGYQVAGDDGRVTFRTIVPGWYSGRTPHIHFKVRKQVTSADASTTQPTRDASTSRRTATAEFTSQLFFRAEQLTEVYAHAPYRGFAGIDTADARDGIYSERLSDGSAAGSHLLLDLRPQGKGHVAEFTILLTDASLAGQRQFGRGGPRRRRPDDALPWWQW